MGYNEIAGAGYYAVNPQILLGPCCIDRATRGANGKSRSPCCQVLKAIFTNYRAAVKNERIAKIIGGCIGSGFKPEGGSRIYGNLACA